MSLQDPKALLEILNDEGNISQLLTQFSDVLKTNFENSNIWLRFGLTLSLLKHSFQAIQAFHECLRIDPKNPLPAMLAAKIYLKDLDDPVEALAMANKAIERCRKLCDGSDSDNCNQQFDNTPAMLSKCFLLASISHSYIYEREPESMKKLMKENYEESLAYLNLSFETFSGNHLIYYHKALHDTRNNNFPAAITNLRQAIKLNPHHVPSIQLLILSKSALKQYQQALAICESALQEFENNIMLLLIKCNLEQVLVEKKGYKSALTTAQHILKCIRRNKSETSVVLEQTTNENQQVPTILVNGLSSGGGSSSGGGGGGGVGGGSIAGLSIATQLTNRPVERVKHQQHLPPIGGANLFADDCNPARSRDESYSLELTVWLLVAEIFIKIGSICDAELCVDESSAHANGALSYKILFVRGLIAKAKNLLMEAKRFFQSSLALFPKCPKALQQVAHVHHLQGNHLTAEKFLKDSLDIDSNCPKSWQYLSLVYIETNQHDLAKECEKKASKLEQIAPIIPISTISRLVLE